MNKFIDFDKFSLDQLTNSFQNNQPFPHVVIDDFLNTQSCEKLLYDLDHVDNKDTWNKHNHDRIQIKWRSNWQCDEDVPDHTRAMIQFFNGGTFLRWLSQLTDMAGLIPDPYLTGGGFNQINRGGVLAIHADGNWHDLMKIHRRLNVIIYLNHDWQDHWGGHLELWDRDHHQQPGQCRVKIRPDFNRCVIFATDDYSYHGHPTPLTCPEDRGRKSLILYYYTSQRPANEVQDLDHHHRAQFHDPAVLGIDYE
jgi:Rps23 Pro-64 3,4-dihydroxylase Tpa1-like proline 4-hydroxylase